MNYDIKRQDLAKVNNCIISCERVIKDLDKSIGVVDFLVKNKAEIKLIEHALENVVTVTVEFYNNEIKEKYNELLEKLGTCTEELTKHYSEE